ncbi:MAG: glycogen synthase [Gammaproteobacteria bacterium]|nr:glycogen synthase [Gammaproteobacteria bacterium]NNF61850.1 glycogen synthase [Gammaproteobacteria bacterium]
MRICLISSEFTPFAKTGGLGDAVAALSSRLYRNGHDVRVFMPLYNSISERRDAIVPVDFLQDLEIQVGDGGLGFSVHTGPQQDDMWLYFINCPALYGRTDLYTADEDEFLRFVMLSRGALECCQRMAWSPELVVCNDWQAALTPLYLKSVYAWDSLFAATSSVVSIHNIGYQGVFGSHILEPAGLADHQHLLDQNELAQGRINFLQTGILHADKITTVSPTYAGEICTPEYGMGLEHLLQQRREDLHGILNGVDYDIWDPGHDTLIPHPYNASNLQGKNQNKTALQNRFGLTPDPAAPLIGIVSRLASQKGFELAYNVLPDLLRDGRIQLAVLGSGEYRYEEFFSWLAQEFPERAGFWRGFSNPLAHLIEAGSDMFLMPSLYEPCGLNQMYSLRYGTVPVVRRTGGLADTVIPHTAAGGNGIVFDHADEAGLRWALETALEMYATPAHWRKLMVNGMRQDFSWERQVLLYEELFSSLLPEPEPDDQAAG